MMIIRGVIVVAVLQYVYSQPCPNSCSEHGRCSSPARQCECFKGFTGADCSLRTCPKSKAWVDQAVGVDDAHNEVECSNMGICDRTTGTCMCRDEFEGIACERQSCPAQCNNVGECQSMYFYALSKDPGTGEVYDYSLPWDAYKIYGCNCDSHYHGTDCSLRYCPKGDDPLTGTTQISNKNPLQFNEIQRIQCKADGGTFTLTFREKTTERIPYDATVLELQSYIEALPTIGKGNTKITMYGGQACSATGITTNVEFLQNFGSLPLLVADKRKLTYSNSLSVSTITIVKFKEGTKEDLECSGRGICDSSIGVCSCSDDFDTSNGYNKPGTRGDCGYATEVIQYCPGALACSAHGKCNNNPTYKCDCADGWTGADCSDRLCPSELVWFSLPEDDQQAHVSEYAECSNAGICDRATGECVCNPGFTGAACNRLSCPGETTDTDGCNGHGRCLDMNSLAALATVNGDLGNFTYGDTPNNPQTWDAFRIFGCLCDPEYMGYDCSQYTCPYGDDPDTTGQFNEQQLISCSDSDNVGNIVLTFRQQTTAPISTSATTLEVSLALKALSSIGEVLVEVDDPTKDDSLCTSGGHAGNAFMVTFLTEHADLPMIQHVTQYVDSFAVSEFVKGTKENIECSGRGLCDHATGLCECFTGFGSSDGTGGKGSLGDCGYIEPIVG